jgi:CRP-like cAMP-binding protein
MSAQEAIASLFVNAGVMMRRFEPHQDLFKVNGTWPGIYVIRSGFACRYTTFADGRRQIIGLSLPGDVCDPGSALIHRGSYSIGAIRTVQASLIPADTFSSLLNSSSPMIRTLWRMTEMDGAIERQWLLNVGQRSALERVAHFVCEIFTRLQLVELTEENTCEFPFTQTEIADATALSQVHVNRTLMQLRRMGMISTRRQRLEIHDLESLRLLCGFSADYLLSRESVAFELPVVADAAKARSPSSSPTVPGAASWPLAHAQG